MKNSTKILLFFAIVLGPAVPAYFVYYIAPGHNLSAGNVLGYANDAYNTMFMILSYLFFIGVMALVLFYLKTKGDGTKEEIISTSKVITFCAAYVAIFVSAGDFISRSIEGRVNAAKIAVEIWEIKNRVENNSGKQLDEEKENNLRLLESE